MLTMLRGWLDRLRARNRKPAPPPEPPLAEPGPPAVLAEPVVVDLVHSAEERGRHRKHDEELKRRRAHIHADLMRIEGQRAREEEGQDG